ncbi:MAG: hypothetical protein NWF11_00675 [Candidatus Bathyarchaeota archaeon]|nr:hypothetical protein [Candidatus Bathyarchaeota archaeon]
MKSSSAVHVIDLTKIEGDGDFPCPRCGAIISPEDTSESTYVIQQVKMLKGEELEQLVIKCNSCGSVIYITGFAPVGASV